MQLLPQRIAALVGLLSLLSGSLLADERHDQRPQRPDTFVDHRYNHDRSYPRRGAVRPHLPPERHAILWRGSRYYFHDGVWYRPARSGWIVVAPPIGLIVPWLPPYHTTIWVRGVPYYYANDVYYSWRPLQRGYSVVRPPAEHDAAAMQREAHDLYIYPKNRQSAEQQSSDRYECHRWAVAETGFDPTQPLGGVSSAQALEKRSAYLRAMTACLEGRGYSVK